MTDTLSPTVLQALRFMEKHVKTQHALFKQIPFKPRSLSRGEAVVQVTPPTDFAAHGHLHGGTYTILLDTMLAVAAWSRMDEFAPMVTINLKTDFFEDFDPGATFEVKSFCDGIRDDVAFCRGQAEGPDGQVLAQAVGTFLVGGPAVTKGSRL